MRRAGTPDVMSTIVYCCPFVPAEWIAAHGLTPARIVPAGESGKVRRCEGAKGFRVERVEAFAGVCPFARGFAESALGLDEPAAIVVTTACDQMRRIGDWLTEHSNRPVFLMNVPSTCTMSARELYASEVRRLGEFLVRLGGKALSDEELARVMMEKEAVRDANNRAPTSEEVGYPALAVVGGPLLAEDFELFEMIEQAGGRVVLDGTEGGDRTRPGHFDRARLAADPFGELVRAYFDVIPDAFRRPDGLLHEWLRREIAAQKVRGVIVHRYVWCDNWHAEVYRLRETLGVPVLDLDNAGAGDGRARARARIEAFVETLA
jgi:benzoyl-CoA reductase/2-hydroxyglutaryl-CoA dehydratase subunit BcrC/BadD/HgdB